MRGSNNKLAKFGRIQVIRILLTLSLAVIAHAAFVQTVPAQGLVLFRNVQIADANGVLVNASVLINSGKITRVDRDSPTPAGAVVIDGGGSVLALSADGTINLSSPLKTTDSRENNSAVVDLKTNPPKEADLSSSSTPIRQPRQKEIGFDQTVYSEPKTTRPNLNSLARSPIRQQGPQDDLASKVVDPSAPLSTILFQEKYVPSLWGIDDDENEVMMQVAIPWKLAKKANIFRVTVPLLTNTPEPGNNGVGDVGILNVTVLPQKWGKLLIGPVASFGTNKGPGVDTFSIGPAVGAIFKHGKWLYGVFNQNLFSFGGDIATSQFQPILAYTVNPKVSLAIGDAQYVFNWKRGGRLTAAPLSGQINYIHMFGEQPVRFFFNAQYSVVNDFGARKWTLSPGFALILK